MEIVLKLFRLVLNVGEGGNDRRLDLLVEIGLKVNVTEPIMLQDFPVAALRAESCFGVFRQQLCNEVLDLIGVLETGIRLPIREGRLPANDLLDHLVCAELAVEWVIAKHQLEDDDAEGPPVNRQGLTSALVDLRGHVLRSAATRPPHLALVESFGEPEVYQLHVAVLVDEDVLELQVSVGDALLVQVADTEHYLSYVELDFFLVEVATGLRIFIELESANKRHDEIKAELILEQIVHPSNERVLAVQKYSLLHLRALDFFFFQKFIFSNAFDCIELVVIIFVHFHFGQVHFSEGAAAQHQKKFEILEL